MLALPLAFPSTERRQRILHLSMPIIGGMLSQNVLNLVDTAMVGSLGNAALAAVGMGGFLNWMAMAFITGLATGVQAMASRRMGEGRESESAVPLNGGLLLSLMLAAPWTLLLFLFAPTIFGWMNPDPEVIRIGGAYFQARLLGMVAVAMNYSFRGYWNGVGLSKIYMRTLIVMHISNVILSWCLIYGKFGLPAMGATGAGLGTTLSTYIGTVMYIVQAFRLARHNGFLQSIPRGETLVTMLKVSIPAGVQQLFFAGGMTAFFWIVGQVGTQELAASNVLVNLMLVGILPGLAFGLASATLVGQALGRKNLGDANLWAWDVSKIAMISIGLITLPAVLFPDFFLGFFLHDAATLALARWPLRLVALTMTWDTLGSVIMQSLLGAGDSQRVMYVSVGFQWLLYLPLLYAGTVWGGMTLLMVWGAQVIYRAAQTLIFVMMWQQGKWKKVKV